MKTSIFLCWCLLLFACSTNKSKDYILHLKPKKGEIYRYAAEDKFQIMLRLPDGNKEIYSKLIYDYSVKYESKDSLLSGTVNFENFRIEFEDGNGIQVFDTKFDSANWKNIELWFYYSLLKKNIPVRFSASSRPEEIKTIGQIKQDMIDAYSRNGITSPQLTSILHRFVDNFVVNRITVENYAFYTGKPLLPDSSYSIGFTAFMPVHHSVQYKYKMRSQTDSTLTLVGKGTIALKDSLKQEFPFSALKNKQLGSEGFDEILLQKQTNVVKYRKSYFNLADSLVIDQQHYPANIIIEKETKLKNTE